MNAVVTGRHVPALDGLRGVAIILVLIVHFNIIGRASGAEGIALRAVLAGWVGVDLFFVLSGFLITGILYRAKGRQRFFSTFYWRRTLRIFPLYYAVLAGVFVLAPLAFPESDTVQRIQGGQWWHWAYLSNVKVALEGWPPERLTVGHFWSLAIEEQFYLVWPLIVFLLPRTTLVAVCVSVIALSPILRGVAAATGHAEWGYVLTPFHADPLAIGALVALVAHGPDGLARFRRWAAPVALACVLILATLFVWRRGFGAWDPYIQALGYTPLALLFGAALVLIVTATADGRLERAMTHPALVTLGKYSYALYVFHVPVSGALQRTIMVPDALTKRLGSVLLAQAAFSSVAFTVSMVLALLSWHTFEKHFIKLKDRVAPAIPSAAPMRAP